MTLRAETIDVALAGRPVLSGVSIACAPGRITGLIGPNGAGKSTLLKALAGLMTLTAGRVTLDGQSLTALPPAELGRHLAYLPQERRVHWPLAARAVVALGRLPHRHSRSGESADDRTAIAQAMDAMDVAHLSARPVSAISGGELARVLLARALAQEAPVIVADEPTAGLDPAHALALFEILRRLAVAGRAVVVALHDLSLAARFCDDVVMLADGRVSASGPAAQVLVPERLDPVFGARMAVGRIEGVPIVVPIAPLS